MIDPKTFKVYDLSIQESIALYRDSLMKDINLSLKLPFKGEHHTTKPTSWNDDIIVFEAPLRQLDWILYPVGEIFTITFISCTAIYYCKIEILESTRKDGSLFYTAKIISPLERHQQRNSFRLDTHFEIYFQRFIDDESLEKKKHTATCLNLSAGGMRFNTKSLLHRRTRLLVDFDFMENHFSLMGEVLDEGEKTPTGYYTYRIRFAHIDKKEEDALSRLLIEKQRELIRLRR